MSNVDLLKNRQTPVRSSFCAFRQLAIAAYLRGIRLRAIDHPEDSRRRISDAEVITTSLVAARFNGCHHAQSRDYLDEHGLIPNMLSPSRLNRRLHGVADLIYTLQQQFGQLWMQMNDDTEYLLDSFPVPLCDNIRIRQSQILKGEEYRGYSASQMDEVQASWF